MSRLTFYTVVLLTSTIWDLYTTWLVTPDLSQELNPLFQAVGGAWPALLLEQVVLTIVVILLVRNSLTAKTCFHPAQPGLSIRYFILGLFFKEPQGWRRMLFRVPDRPGAIMYVIGSITFFAVPLAHLQAGFSNWLGMQNASYGSWFDDNLPWSWLALTCGVVPISIGAFLVRDYAIYRRSSSQQGVAS